MNSILIKTALITGVIASALGCAGDQGFVKQPDPVVLPNADIIVTPPSLTFGTLLSNENETQIFTITSVGEAPVQVTDITIEDSGAYTILSATEYLLNPDDTVDIEVMFEPLAVDNVGRAVVHSNDTNDPELYVDLSGFGTVPELTITPEHHDFGTRFIPCDDTVTLTLSNTGTDLLTIDTINGLSDGDFVLTDNNQLPMTLDPAQSITVDVTYTPTIEGTTTGVLEVLSNDPRGLVTADQTGSAQYAAFTTDTHTVPIDPPVDILFAVDQSCSMDSHAGQLASNFSSFISQIDSATNGWRIGVANVGINGQPNGVAGCFVNGILSSTTPNYQGLFQSAVVEGDDPQGTATYSEYLTQLVDLALSKTAPGQCNSGFLRPGALLHIVLVSDEYNHSPETWSYYLTNYQQFVSDPSLLKVSGIIGNGGVSFCSSGNGGYPGIIQTTGGETIDVCGNNWAADLTNLGVASLNGISNFELDNPADASSVQVTVNGTPRSDWTYDTNTNEVRFDTTLEGGDNVVIEYGVAVGCN